MKYNILMTQQRLTLRVLKLYSYVSFVEIQHFVLHIFSFLLPVAHLLRMLCGDVEHTALGQRHIIFVTCQSHRSTTVAKYSQNSTPCARSCIRLKNAQVGVCKGERGRLCEQERSNLIYHIYIELYLQFILLSTVEQMSQMGSVYQFVIQSVVLNL